MNKNRVISPNSINNNNNNNNKLIVNIWISYFHAIMIITYGTLHLLYKRWSSTDFISMLKVGNTTNENIILSLSMIYFIYDSIYFLIISYRSFHRREIGMMLHHLICMIGLGNSIFRQIDATIIIIGLVLGEMSNPPRLLYRLVYRVGRLKRVQFKIDEFLYRFCKTPREREYWLNTLMISHIILFAIGRLIAVHVCAHIVIPHSKHELTTICGVGIVVFSLVALWEYCVNYRSSGRLGDVVI